MAEARALAEGAVGLADLLACAEVMDDARLQRIAALMGLECRKPEPKDAKQEESGKSPVVEGGKNVATGDVRSDTAAAPAGEHRYFRVVRMRTIDADGDDTEPTRRIQYARAVEPLGDNPYLIPWSRTWPFLRVALGEDSERRELAIPHLVRRIARGETLRRLPRRHLRRWALRAHLLIDLDERLEPIRNEQYRIRDLLPMLRGHEGLEIFAFKRGPSGAIQRWDGQRWREETGPYRPPEAGTRVLIIGDLGRYAGEPLREDWLALGREFKLRGIDPMLLAPCPSRWWDSRWRDVFKPVTLDQGAQLPRRRDDPRPWMLGGGQNEAVKVHRDKHAKELLALLAPAVRITPALLRRLRWGLRPARGDIGSELAAWTHPELVRRFGAVRPIEDTPWRESRGRCPVSAIELADELILQRQVQEDAPRSRRMAERARMAAFRGGVDDEAEKFLQEVGAVFGDMADDEPLLAARREWVLRTIERMEPEDWRRSEASHQMYAAACPDFVDADPEDLPPGFDPTRARRLRGLSLPRRRWRVRDGQGDGCQVLVAAFDAPSSNCSRPAPVLEVESVRFGLTDGPAGRVFQDGTRIAGQEITLRSDRAEYHLDAMKRPAWAHGIGRDELGLFVDFAANGGERRAYWWPPGEYPVVGEALRDVGVLVRTQGAFMDAGEYIDLISRFFPRPDWASNFGVDGIGIWAEFECRGVRQRMRWIAPGEFLMGSPKDEHERRNNETQHEVMLTRGYWLAETACKQALWQAVMGDNPSEFKGEQNPVEQVSWEQVQKFIGKLNDLCPGLGLRLPSEAEWEYACRAGTEGPFSVGEDIDPTQVNYDGNYPYRGDEKGEYRKRTVAVGSLPANPWGLYEMHGNVWEWCADWLGDYPPGPVQDPEGPEAGALRVVRGGSWFYDALHCRSARRDAFLPSLTYHDLGFRLARGRTGERSEGKEAPGRTEAARERGTRGRRTRSGPAGLLDRLLGGKEVEGD